MVNKGFIWPCFLGGYLRGVWLTSHNYSSIPLATSKNIGARRSFSNFGGKCEAKKNTALLLMVVGVQLMEKWGNDLLKSGEPINGKVGKQLIETLIYIYAMVVLLLLKFQERFL